VCEARNGKRKEELKITEAGGRFQKTLGVCWNHSYPVSASLTAVLTSFFHDKKERKAN